MTTTGTRVDVDDGDPRILYSSGWGQGGIAGAYAGTLHYATAQGLTATFTFTGTMVGVYGCGGDTNQYGWPSESFSIDNKVYGTRNDPNATATVLYCGVSFFTSPSLTPGVHTLVVTNTNGTSPLNTLWLDRFWFIPSDVASGTAVSSIRSSVPSSTASSKSTSTSPLSSLAATSASTSAHSASASATGGGAISSGSHTQNVAAIVGGAVSGAVAVLLVATLGVYCFIKRRRKLSARARPESQGEVGAIAFTEGTPTSPSSGGHDTRRSFMQESPAVTPSQGFFSGNVYTGAPLPVPVSASTHSSPTSGSTLRRKSGVVPPRPLPTPQPSPAAPSLPSAVRPESFDPGHRDTNSELDDFPPPYAR